METKIQIAERGQARDCLICVKNSDLWDEYFKTNPSHESTLEEMILKKQVYVATNRKDKCIGFMGVINNGCFSKFSYLAILAVNKRYRNKGIGYEQLLLKATIESPSLFGVIMLGRLLNADEKEIDGKSISDALRGISSSSDVPLAIQSQASKFLDRHN